MRKVRTVLAIAVAAFGATLLGQDAFFPARYRSGTLPALAPLAVGGGEVFLEASVSADGRVAGVTPLRTTPPFTDLLVAAVKGWQFQPAEIEVDPEPGRPPSPRPRRPVPSRVLVAGLFRRPALLGPSLGEVPRDIKSESDEVPFPMTAVEPPYHVSARNGGVVLIEVKVGVNGNVAEARLLRSAPPFDDAALDAARRWAFRPARVRGRSFEARAYLVFGFRAPVGPSPPDCGLPPLPPCPPPPASPK